MSVITDLNISGTRIVCWQITESADILTGSLPENIQKEAVKYTHIGRREEFAASRLCLQHAGFKDPIYKDTWGKPFINNAHIGITHTDGFAAVIISKTMCVAIDAEQPDVRLLRTAPRFLNNYESEYCGNDIEKIALIWCCKECIYKLYGHGYSDFKQSLEVKETDDGNFEGKIQGKDIVILRRLNLSGENMPVIVWCSQAPENIAIQD